MTNNGMLHEKIRQRLPHDCGVACLAMVAAVSYETAALAFSQAGLSQRRKQRPPFSSNFNELLLAGTFLGIQGRRRRFRSWNDVDQKAIIKVRPQKSGNWHWVVAGRDSTGIFILDPATELPSFQTLPFDTEAINFDFYAPDGCFIEIFTH